MFQVVLCYNSISNSIVWQLLLTTANCVEYYHSNIICFIFIHCKINYNTIVTIIKLYTYS